MRSAEFSIRPVEQINEAFAMATIRNTGREFMTHDSHEISQAEQADWYFNTYKPEHKNANLYGFVGYMALQPVAYGLISRKNGAFWLSGVVDEVFQGRGFGRQMFESMGKFVLNGHDDKVMLDVYETNTPAKALYDSLGYSEVSRDSGVIVMKLEAPDEVA